MKTLFLILTLWVLAVPSASAAMPVVWDDLKDPEAARFEDPFEALFLSELRSIATVYRLRQWLKRGDLDAGERTKAETRLRREEAKLAAAGVETDYLLSQRKLIADRQAEAALKGNPDLAGKEIAITGYVIPILDEKGQAGTGYLVPGFGMCSHVPAPAPNQMIRYRLSEDWKEAELYRPVLLSGRLDFKVSRQTITLLDGPVIMTAAFDMEVRELRPLDQSTSGAEQRNFRNFRPTH